MRRSLRGIALAGLLLSLTAAKEPPYVYGPAPEWSHYKALGETAIKALLPDPDDWEVLWPNGYVQAGWKHKGPQVGYMTCGTLHAVRMVDGGYPSHPFAIVIDQDRVKLIDYQPKPQNSLVNILCAALVAHGKLPPATMMTSEVTTIVPLGLTIRPVIDGAVVVGVTDGSPSKKAGIAISSLITKVNGIALAGMGPAMVKVLESDAPTLLLETAGGRQVEISRTR